MDLTAYRVNPNVAARVAIAAFRTTSGEYSMQINDTRYDSESVKIEKRIQLRG